MDRNSNFHFSRWLYKIGAFILFVLAVIALIAFVKALFATDCKEPERTFTPADSVQVENLRQEVSELSKKVDSLLILSQKQPQKVYRYIKPKKDSCTIEVNIHNK